MTTPYDPATPLRADATDGQIISRHINLTVEGKGEWTSVALVARELQAATVAEHEAKLAKLEVDKALLDFMEQELLNGHDIQPVFFPEEFSEFDGKEIPGGFQMEDDDLAPYYSTFREAIDAARATQPETK